MKGAKEQYETFVKNHPAGTFFQSWLFGEFQEKIPYRGKAWTLLCHCEAEGRSSLTGCLVIKIKLPMGKCWLWIPYGPLGFAEEIFEDIARIAKEENAVFVRIEPPLASLDCFVGLRPPRNDRVVPSPKRFTPEHSLILNLAKSESEILAQMKPKGRYNINVAKKNGVIITSSDDVEAFHTLLKKTSERDAFGIHPAYFYKNLLETFGENAQLFIAYKSPGAHPIAGIIVIFYKDTATYYYGASDYMYRNLMAPYLLQWEAICEAKRRGMKFYDFLGVAPPGAQNHPWTGVTDFKKKFGGVEIHYPAAFDIIYKPLLYKTMILFR